MPTPTDSAPRIASRANRDAKKAAAQQPAVPQAFTHQVIAPYVPEDPHCSTQRYFTRGDTNRAVELRSAMRRTAPFEGDVYSSADVKVYRVARDDTVQLRLAINTNWNQCDAGVHCNAIELREIAARLLDAAHDLDTNPSSKLMVEAA